MTGAEKSRPTRFFWTGWFSILLAFLLVISGVGSSLARSVLTIAPAPDGLQVRGKSEKLKYPRVHHEFRNRDSVEIKGAVKADCDGGIVAVPPDVAIVLSTRGCPFFSLISVPVTSRHVGSSPRAPPASVRKAAEEL